MTSANIEHGLSKPRKPKPLKGDASIGEIMSAPPVQGVEQLLSPTEVCRIAGVTKSTIYTWIRRGIFPPPTLRIGLRKVAWTRTAIESWMTSRLAV